jgi:hypothetical protein
VMRTRISNRLEGICCQYLLMIKFGKSEKIGLSGLGNQSIRFWQFQDKIKEEAKLEDLKIQECL